MCGYLLLFKSSLISWETEELSITSWGKDNLIRDVKDRLPFYMEGRPSGGGNLNKNQNEHDM